MPKPTERKPTKKNPQKQSQKPNNNGNGNGNSEAAASVFQRELPHSLEAERALLGSMLLDPAAIADAITTLEDTGAEVFFSNRHRSIYELIRDLWSENRALDAVVIENELRNTGTLEAIGGIAFLGELIDSVPSALRVLEYAQIVKDTYLLRNLIGSAHEILQSAIEPTMPASEILDDAERIIFDVTQQRVTGGAEQLPDLIEQVFAQIEEFDGRSMTGLPTGFYELDQMTCGFQPGELIILAGRPSMGKTACGLNIAEHMSLKAGHPLLFFSMEMSNQQVAQRILCSQASVNAHKLRQGQHSDADLRDLQRAAANANDRPFFVDDTAGLTIMELRARARVAHRKHGIQAIMVDYLQLMHAPGLESRQQEVATISRGLKALAKELKIPVVAMAQLNRGVEDRKTNRPRMSDLRESGAIEQDADVIILLHREAYYKVGMTEGQPPPEEEDNKAELIVAKQRNGPVGTVDVRFDKRFARFRNYAPGEHYDGTPEAQGE